MRTNAVNRTQSSPSSAPSGRQSQMMGIYRGIVKNNLDDMGMGRCQIYVPAFGGDPNDERTWYTATPVTPQMGATNPQNSSWGGEEDVQSQDSYGIMNPGQQIENVVLISFLGGNSKTPVIIGNMMQQNMSNSIAGFPSGVAHQGTINEVHPPVTEYNKQDSEINPREPVRPRQEVFARQLFQQGVYRDMQRGQSSTSPLRDQVPQFTSIKTPRGNTFVMDDGSLNRDSGAGVDERSYTRSSNAQSFIRMRSSSGAQLYLNDGDGYVYMNSAKGMGFMQIADDSISLYSKSNISFRAKGGVVMRVDGNYNLEVLNNMAIKTESFTLNCDNLNIIETGNGTHIESNGDISMKSDGFIGFNSSSHNKNGATIFEKAANIFENSGMPTEYIEPDEVVAGEAQDRRADGLQNSVESSESTLPDGGLVTHQPSSASRATGGYDPSAPGANCNPTSTQELGDGSATSYPSNPTSEQDTTGQVPADSSDPSAPVNPEYSGVGGLLEYTNQGATRNRPVTQTLVTKLITAVAAFYGQDYRIEVYSGGQAAIGTGGSRTGTVRHDNGHAADIYIIDPSGRHVPSSAQGGFAQYWLDKNNGSVGVGMNRGGIHLDEWGSSTGPQLRGGMGYRWSY